MDPIKPNISRIYDYVLGGQHNLEVDRSAAQHILKVFPAYPLWARLNREFLQVMARQWAAEGQTHVLDLGSGMPTQGHFHSVMPNARILYSDNDPVTVEYARTLIGDNPAVAYLEADVRQPEALLRAAEQHFHGARKVAIGFIGVAYFVDDASLARVMRTLHDWAAPGSVMALSQTVSGEMTETGRQQMESFKRGGVELLPRSEAALRRLVEPWEIREFAPLERWPGIETRVQASDRGDAKAGMLGVRLVRPG
ncbi:S-adenosyl methyltransferase [Stigmatella aurantiaca]|uniref:S-adenosyl methyltransferase n=1 Tax=Stigmatella aurantiaca TaxID=41 RepID=A0A1H8A4J2_STIAU|nr:SAM-dependent methyltransferase [Stigmatella aurantiaca]SEM65620.1 S-adenosyl methyltransferase [Stigmatella aurantiaca]